MVEMSKFLNTASSQLVKGNEIIKSQSAAGGGGESGVGGRSFGSNLKVWQLALLIGVPTGVVAYLLYRYANQRVGKSAVEDKKVSAAAKTTAKSEQPVKEQPQKLDTTPKTPFERAVDMKNQGNKFFQQGKFQEAAECYSEAINLCPLSDKQELPKFYQNRAAAYENLKLFDKVIEDCTAALNVDQGYTKALMRRAKAYENIDQLQEAFEDLTKLCILEKFSASAMASADRMVKKIGQKMASDKFKARNGLAISQHFVNNFYIGLNNDIVFNNKAFYEKVEASESSTDMLNALKDFNEGRFTSCIENCSKVIDSDSDQFALEARNLRGSLYMLKCQYKEAIADFEAILSNEGDKDKADNRLKSNTLIKFTALNLQNGQEDEAFANYERAVEIDPTNEDIYCNRAQVFAMKGRFQECFDDFNKCIELNNDHKIAKLQKAFFEFRQFYAQLTMYKQATEGSNSHEAIINSKELKEETTKLEKLISEYSDIPEAYNLYAQILSEQENFEKAENYYKIALERDPKNAALLVQRALNHMTWKNEFDEAINMLNDAIQVDDTCEFAYETLATIEIQRGNLPRAVELFEKAIELTRNEESMTNLCSMLVGAQTQFKVLKSNTSSMPNGLDFFNSLGI